MPQRSANIGIGVTGEAEYRRAITNINNEMKVLNAEMKKTTAAFEDNADSMDALNATGDVLQRQLEAQKNKVKALQEVVAYNAQVYGATDNATLKWQASLVRAETEVIKLERAVAQNTSAIEEQTSAVEESSGSMTSAGDAAQQLADKFGITIPDGARKALDGFGSFSTKTATYMAAAAAAVAALIKVEKELLDMTMDVAAEIDELATQSKITGLSTQALQEIEYASSILDVSSDRISDSLKEITNKMADVQDGNEELANKFNALGVSITNADGSLRSASDVFYDTVDALGQIKNATERDALAMDLFGESARELNPLILEGSAAMRALAAEANATGYVLGVEQVASLQLADDAYQRLQSTQEAMRKQMSAEFAPAAEQTFTAFQRLVVSAGTKLVDSGIIAGLGSILDSTVSILEPIGQLANILLPAINIVLQPLAFTLAAVADALDLISGIITLNGSKISQALGFGYSSGNANNIQRWRMGYEGRLDEYDSYYRGRVSYNASGNDNFEGGFTWLGENGPEIAYLPRGTQISSSQESRELIAGDSYYFNVNIEDLEDLEALIRWAKNFKVTTRMRG